MKSYPSISTQVDMSLSYWVFDKLDGSNLRAEWSPKRGFYKFGSRTQLLTPDQADLWPAVARIEALSDELSPRLAALRAERVVCFFEWFGPRSFAGRHIDPLEDMRLALLDIDVYKRGFLAPDRLMELATSASVPMPGLVHVGRVDKDFLGQVRAGTLPGVSLEGIIGKTAQDRASTPPIMFKHKAQAWYDRLREMCAGDQALFDRLS